MGLKDIVLVDSHNGHKYGLSGDGEMSVPESSLFGRAVSQQLPGHWPAPSLEPVGVSPPQPSRPRDGRG